MPWKVVIAGGGFGGFYAARELERRLPEQSALVTLVSDTNYLLFPPLMAGAAAATLEPRHVVVPLRKELKRTNILRGTVTAAVPDERRVQVRTETGDEELEYDHLIVALGSVSRTLPIPGLAEHGVGLKTLGEAIGLRNRVIRSLEVAENVEDPEERAAYLTFVFVGGGYAGLEALAELQDFAADVIHHYPRCRMAGMRWILVEAQQRVMVEVPDALATFATRELRGRGVEVLTDTTVEEVTEATARLSTGEVVPTRMLVWTAGVRPAPVVQRLGLPVNDGGRIRVDAEMRVEGHDHEWAVGDAAAVPDPAKDGGQPCPPTAQHATRQGQRVGRNVAAVMGAQVGEPQPFRYKTRGVFVDMGRQRAVAQTMGIKWSGFPAFLLARAYYISEIPGLGRKLRLLTDWTVGMLFGRDSSELGQIGRARSLSQEMEAAETPEGEKKGEGESGGAEAVDGARESDEAGGNGAQVAGSRSAG